MKPSCLLVSSPLVELIIPLWKSPIHGSYTALCVLNTQFLRIKIEMQNLFIYNEYWRKEKGS